VAGEKRPASLKDSIHKILCGSNTEKEKIQGQFFCLADTPQFMKELGLTGDYFSVRYGVIVRHQNKDDDHNLTEQNWINLCEKITEPFAIVIHNQRFRLFTDVMLNGRNVVICVDVKRAGKNFDVNAISTVFGYRNRPITGEILYRSKKITPEQAALLDRPNALSLPPDRGRDAEHDVQL
jgi:hypothetical protein